MTANRFVSTLVHVMASCLTAPSHYMNQCWQVIVKVLWHSPEGNFAANAQATILYNEFENYIFQNTSTSPRDQWVKTMSDFLLDWMINNQRNQPVHCPYQWSTIIMSAIFVTCRMWINPFGHVAWYSRPTDSVFLPDNAVAIGTPFTNTDLT